MDAKDEAYLEWLDRQLQLVPFMARVHHHADALLWLAGLCIPAFYIGAYISWLVNRP